MHTRPLTKDFIFLSYCTAGVIALCWQRGTFMADGVMEMEKKWWSWVANVCIWPNSKLTVAISPFNWELNPWRRKGRAKLKIRWNRSRSIEEIERWWDPNSGPEPRQTDPDKSGKRPFLCCCPPVPLSQYFLFLFPPINFIINQRCCRCHLYRQQRSCVGLQVSNFLDQPIKCDLTQKTQKIIAWCQDKNIEYIEFSAPEFQSNFSEFHVANSHRAVTSNSSGTKLQNNLHQPDLFWKACHQHQICILCIRNRKGRPSYWTFFCLLIGSQSFLSS